MDKRIALKKTRGKRIVKNEIPDLKSGENLLYLHNYFIENSILDSSISDRFTVEIKKKLESYKRQDIKKDRYDVEYFINLHECYSKMLSSKLKCYYCKCETVVFYTEVRQDNQWTLERIDNNIGHTNDNTVVCCLECNLKRGTRNSNHYQFAKQLVIKKI
jgi:hypothetical protein